MRGVQPSWWVGSLVNPTRQMRHVTIKMIFLGWGSLGLSHVREPRDLEHRCVGAPVWAPGAGGRAPMAAPPPHGTG